MPRWPKPTTPKSTTPKPTAAPAAEPAPPPAVSLRQARTHHLGRLDRLLARVREVAESAEFDQRDVAEALAADVRRRLEMIVALNRCVTDLDND